MKFFENLQIKILSLGSAFLLWLFVVGVQNYVYLFPTELPVKVINLGQNVSVAREIGKVKVRYKTQNESNATNINEFEVYLDAGGLSDGEFNLPVNYISKNPGLMIVATEPSALSLKLEAITSKEISLKVETTGSPAKDYEVKDVKLALEKVKLSGAASAISSLSELKLKIALDGTENADFSRKITLEAPEDWKLNGKTVSFDPATVQVDIEVRKKPKPAVSDTPTSSNSNADTPTAAGMERKTLMVEIVKPADLQTAIKETLPQNILVTLEGKPEDIKALNNGSIKLFMHSSDIANASYTVNPADIDLPEGLDLKVIEFSPEKVSVRF